MKAKPPKKRRPGTRQVRYFVVTCIKCQGTIRLNLVDPTEGRVLPSGPGKLRTRCVACGTEHDYATSDLRSIPLETTNN